MDRRGMPDAKPNMKQVIWPKTYFEALSCLIKSMGKNDDDTLSLLAVNARRLQEEIKEINTGKYDNAYRLQRKRGKEAPNERVITMASLYDDMCNRIQQIKANV